jgi:hypothetical protein
MMEGHVGCLHCYTDRQGGLQAGSEYGQSMRTFHRREARDWLPENPMTTPQTMQA